MREDRAAHPFGVPLGGENLATAERMILRGRPPFVVEVVEQAHDPPVHFRFAESACVSTNRGFDGEGVFPEAFALRVLGQQPPGCLSAEYGLDGVSLLPLNVAARAASRSPLDRFIDDDDRRLR